MRLSRLQTPILWATFSLVLLEVIYPPMVLLLWNNAQEKWEKISLQTYALGVDKPLEQVGARKFAIGLNQWDERVEAYRLDFKEIPDLPRVAIEGGAIAMIGVGLAYALRLRT